MIKARRLGVLALAPLLFEARAFAKLPADLIVIAEQASPAANIPSPSPGHPVSYLAYDAGFIEAGEPIAGIQPPSSSEVAQGLRAALDAAGYSIATAQNEPSIVLIYHYGTLRPKARTISGGAIDFNLQARVNLVTTTDMALKTLRFIFHGSQSNAGFVIPNVQDSLDLIQDPRYYFIIAAYNYDDLCQQKPTELWRVKLSTPERGNSLGDVLPRLAAASQTYLGANFPDRQHASIFADTDQDRALPAPTATPAFPLPRRAVEKINARFMRALTLYERAAITNSDPALSVKNIANRPANPSTTVVKSDPSRDPSELAAQSPFPPSLAQKIALYQSEKDALQAALTTKVQAADPGSETRNAIDAFNHENAERISRLGQTREDIRSQLAVLVAARPNSSGKSLDSLLLEFAAEIQRMEPAANPAAP